MSRSSYRLFAAILSVVLTFSAIGCEKARLQVHPVEVKVLFRGQPAANAELVLHPVDGGDEVQQLRPNGRVEANGNLILTTYERGDGAPAGQYKITVKWRVSARKSDDPETAEENAVDPLNGRFGDVQSTELMWQVKEGTNQLPPLELAR